MIVGLQRLLWSRFTWRHARLAPVSSLLLVTILALGVAVYFSIRLANRAAVSSFQNFTEILTAESDGQISAPAGSLPERTLGELRTAFGTAPVHLVPVLESTAARPGKPDAGESIGQRETFQILGVDLIAVQNLPTARDTDRSWFAQTDPGTHPTASTEGFWKRFRDPRAVFLPQALAARNRLVPGSLLPLVINESVVDLHVAGIIPADPSRPAPPDALLVMDLPALQVLTGRTGRVDRIEFVLPDGPDRAARWALLRAELVRLGDGRWNVGSPSDRRDSAALMTQAFRLNLTVLSLLALLVGLYLVVQALDGAVIRRREEIAVLRALGVGTDAIRRAWLAEAAVLGLAGGAVGLLLGWAGAQAAVRVVGQTVNALYYATSARAAALEPGEALVALGIAVLSSVLAGWWPARLAASTPPAQLLGRGRAGTPTAPARWTIPVSIALLLTGLLLCLAPPLRLEGGGRISLAAYATALFWLLAAGLLAGQLPPVAATLLRPLGHLSVPFRIALSHLRRPTGRHRLAIAGLVCAVAMTAGMAILVGSFDTTMRGWIERTFMADLYVTSDGAQSASSQNRIRAEVWHSLVGDPEVLAANVVQVVDIRLPGGSTLLVGGNPAFMRDHARIAWREEPQDARLWDPESNEGLAIASESFSERFQLHRGDPVTIPTPTGPREVRLAGIFSDYGNERGSLVVQREHFERWFEDAQATSVIVKLRDGTRADALRAGWRREHPGLAVFTNPHLRAEALRIFRQTFAITHALELIGIGVSVAGLGLSLASLLWERRSDLTVLRALGLRRGELALAAALEGVLTAAVGLFAGLATSLALGWLLIHRVNFQTFGWTLESEVPALWLAALSALVLSLAAATGWVVGRWGSTLPAETEE
jgi:putative ABC transport system permease protein